MSIDSLSPLNCVRGQPLEGLQPLTVSVCVCICACVSGVEDKWLNSLITSAVPVGVPTAGEQRGTERS